MADRDALRRLSRKFPAPPEMEKILDELRNKDDLHTAIIAVSIVEASLETLLVSRLHKSDKDFLNRLFQNRGPLSDFNSKILIGEALGILTTPLAAELHSMRTIRNAFAHAKTLITFEDEPVKREVDALKMIKAIRGAGSAEAGVTLELSSKNWFLLAARLALIMIDSIEGSKGTADKIIEDALR
jgi:DNA-binding MltR family transcriptional regulator